MDLSSVLAYVAAGVIAALGLVFVWRERFRPGSIAFALGMVALAAREVTGHSRRERRFQGTGRRLASVTFAGGGPRPGTLHLGQPELRSHEQPRVPSAVAPHDRGCSSSHPLESSRPDGTACSSGIRRSRCRTGSSPSTPPASRFMSCFSSAPSSLDERRGDAARVERHVALANQILGPRDGSAFRRAGIPP